MMTRAQPASLVSTRVHAYVTSDPGFVVIHLIVTTRLSKTIVNNGSRTVYICVNWSHRRRAEIEAACSCLEGVAFGRELDGIAGMGGG